MSRKSFNGRQFEDIFEERVVSMVEYLADLEEEPKDFKTVIFHFSLIGDASHYLIRGILDHIAHSSSKKPESVSIQDWKKAKFFAEKLYVKRAHKNGSHGNTFHIPSCTREITREIMKRAVERGYMCGVHQADLIRALQPKGWGQPLIRQALVNLVKAKYATVAKIANRLYYTPTEEGIERAKKYI